MRSELNQDILDLLCDRATVGLSAEDEARLRDAAGGSDLSAEAESLELAAAALAVEFTASEPLPPALYDRILESSREHFSTTKAAAPAQAEPEAEPETQKVFTPEIRPRRSFFAWAGWAVAAAACIALALNLYLTRNLVPPQIADVNSVVPEPQSLAKEREQLIASAPDLTIAEWTKGNVKGLENVTGDVVWSDSLQKGYMRFRGLPPNDPGREAYQLWIFDETQSEKTPIDGGVFDVNSDGEVIIPINAKLKAKNPKAFAVTIERPGGVVVSSREKIAALAPVRQSLKQNQT